MSNTTSSGLTDEQSQLLINAIDAISAAHFNAYRKVEFLNKGKNCYWTSFIFPTTFFNYGRFDDLDEYHYNQINEVDLFAFLHLEPEISRNLSTLEQAFKEKDVLIALHELAQRKIQQANINDVEQNKLISFKSTLAEISTSDVALKQEVTNIIQMLNLPTSDLPRILDLFLNEYEIFIKLIDSTETTYSKIIENQKKLLAWVKRSFSDNLLRQHYEDLWVTSRAMEQSPIQCYLINDEISYLQTVAPTKNDFPDLINNLESNINFEKIDSKLKLTEASKQSIRADITKLFDKYNFEILSKLFSFANTLISPHLNAINNLAIIYKILKKEWSSGLVSINDIFLGIDSEQLSSLQELTKFFSIVLDETTKKPVEIYTEANMQLLSIVRRLEASINEASQDENEVFFIKNLLDVFNQIQEAFNMAIIEGVDIFYGEENIGSFFDFILVLTSNFQLYFTAFAGNFKEFLFAKNLNGGNAPSVEDLTNSIINRVENKYNTKLKLLKKFQNYSDEEYIKVRQDRNDKLLKIVRLEYENGKKLSDHKNYIARLYRKLAETNIYLINGDELNNALNITETNLDEIGHSLENICNVVLEKYKGLLQHIRKSGIKEISIISLRDQYSGNDKENVMRALRDLQECIGLLQLLGFEINQKNLEQEFDFKINQQYLVTYCRGY
jgi:hypothetical protein